MQLVRIDSPKVTVSAFYTLSGRQGHVIHLTDDSGDNVAAVTVWDNDAGSGVTRLLFALASGTDSIDSFNFGREVEVTATEHRTYVAKVAGVVEADDIPIPLGDAHPDFGCPEPPPDDHDHDYDNYYAQEGIYADF